MYSKPSLLIKWASYQSPELTTSSWDSSQEACWRTFATVGCSKLKATPSCWIRRLIALQQSLAIFTTSWILPDASTISSDGETFKGHKHHLSTEKPLISTEETDASAFYRSNEISDVDVRLLLLMKYKFKALGPSGIQARDYEEFNEKVTALSRLQFREILFSIFFPD